MYYNFWTKPALLAIPEPWLLSLLAVTDDVRRIDLEQLASDAGYVTKFDIKQAMTTSSIRSEIHQLCDWPHIVSIG